METSNILPYSAKVTAKTGLSDKELLPKEEILKPVLMDKYQRYFVHRYTTAELAL